MIYVITAVHNRYEITKKFISNLKKQTFSDYRLLLVDDGSTDGTAEMVNNELDDAIVLYGNGNLWWGGALHEAYKYLSKNREECDYVLFINDDTYFENDFIEIAVDLLSKNPNSLITACGYHYSTGVLLDGPVFYDVKRGEVTRLEAGEQGNCASTRALFMTYETFKDIGGFHPILLPHYASDYEYTIRAAKKGHPIRSFKQLRYTFDPGTTGYNSLKDLSLKQVFCKRSRFNPFYRIVFCLMTTPIYYLPFNIYCGIKRIFGELK